MFYNSFEYKYLLKSVIKAPPPLYLAHSILKWYTVKGLPQALLLNPSLSSHLVPLCWQTWELACPTRWTAARKDQVTVSLKITIVSITQPHVKVFQTYKLESYWDRIIQYKGDTWWLDWRASWSHAWPSWCSQNDLPSLDSPSLYQGSGLVSPGIIKKDVSF